MPATQPSTAELMQALHYRLDQWLATVGTIGDRTTRADIDKLAALDVPGLRATIGPADPRILSDKDMLAVQAEVRRATEQARDILTNDCIGQRLARSVGSAAYGAIENGKGLLTSLVDPGRSMALPPLALFATHLNCRVR